jgi:hypothetical protein
VLRLFGLRERAEEVVELIDAARRVQTLTVGGDVTLERQSRRTMGAGMGDPPPPST